MTKIRLEWTTQVTETYSTDVDYEDFASAVRARGDEPPTLEEIQAGDNTYVNWDDLGAEFEDGALDSVGVYGRELETIIVIKP
jgi:hypothetical protein